MRWRRAVWDWIVPRGPRARSWRPRTPDRRRGVGSPKAQGQALRRPRRDTAPQPGAAPAATSPGDAIVRAGAVIDTAVFSVVGERCGRICDICIDKRSGRVVYALIAVEGALGDLQRVAAAPWSLFRYDARRSG